MMVPTDYQQVVQEESDGTIYMSAIPASFALGVGAWVKFIALSMFAVVTEPA